MTVTNNRQKILFLCTGNSCRSQMAEGWTRYLKNDRFEVWSAGIESHGLNPCAVKVMAEAGVDISHHQSTLLDDVLNIPFDVVVTVCDHARESCPFFPNPVHRVHQSFDDPPFIARDADSDEEVLNIYRRVRDEIKSFVLGMPENLCSREEK